MPNSVGRPRDKSIDDDILKAVADILTEKGYMGLKMDTVAARANVSKHTLYLRYKSPAELTVALLKQLAGVTVRVPDTGKLADDLLMILVEVRHLFCDTPFGAVIPALVGASTSNPELVTYARKYLEDRRKQMEPVVEYAIARGELPESVQPKVFIELCIAPIYYRHLISGEPLSDEFIGLLAERAAKLE